jgi:hypothetical protein
LYCAKTIICFIYQDCVSCPDGSTEATPCSTKWLLKVQLQGAGKGVRARIRQGIETPKELVRLPVAAMRGVGWVRGSQRRGKLGKPESCD